MCVVPHDHHENSLVLVYTILTTDRRARPFCLVREPKGFRPVCRLRKEVLTYGELLRSFPAFLASATDTLQLQDHILASTHISDDPLAESLKSRWEAKFGPSPAAQSAHRQSSWDRPGILAANAKVEEARSSPFQRAGLLAARAPHSGDWLFSLPISAPSLRAV